MGYQSKICFLTKRNVSISVILILATVYFLYLNQYTLPVPLMDYQLILNDISCYGKPDKYLRPVDFDNIITNRTIFFIESSCKGSLNSKQACAVESAAAANPNWLTIVLFVGPLTDSFVNSETALRLKKIHNLQFARLNVKELSKGTPLENLFSKNVLKDSSHPVVHSSDILRILILYKYSGLYLDLDVLVIKSFQTLPNNFVSRESNGSIASGILALSEDEIGRNFSEIATRDLASSYQPSSWAGNGPALILRTLNKICNTTTVSQMNASTCHGIEVFEQKYFFPIPYPQWKKYYEDTQPIIGEEYTHHTWNALAYKNQVPQNSMYARLAQKYCPSVYKIYGANFGS